MKLRSGKLTGKQTNGNKPKRSKKSQKPLFLKKKDKKFTMKPTGRVVCAAIGCFTEFEAIERKK